MADKLSTVGGSRVDMPVDILCLDGAQDSVKTPAAVRLPSSDDHEVLDERSALGLVWTGLVVPKRHAKRSVTRTLMKRQIRTAFESVAAGLPSGMWVVRLRAPFGKADYPSASSAVLKQVVRDELTSLMTRAVQSRAVNRMEAVNPLALAAKTPSGVVSPEPAASGDSP